MVKAKFTLAEIIDDVWDQITNNKRYTSYQLRHLYAIKSCRTSALGGHLYQCNKCNHYHKRYHSCRNRHCPTCQQTQRHKWIEARRAELLPTKYYHVVFTLPSVLHELCLCYPREVYNILFKSSWSTLETLGWDRRYLGAQMGSTMILHTWGQNLSLHPHAHCILPGGGIDYKGRWKQARGKGKYLFPVKVMSKVFRGKFIAELKEWLQLKGMDYSTVLHQKLYKNDWVVYCKRPFNGAEGVIEYLGRYVYKTAISNHRIIDKDESYLKIRYKDYRHGGKVKLLKLSKLEFIRRFTLHLLPKGFTRIRHFGILSGRLKHQLLDLPRHQPTQTWEEYWKEKGLHVNQCPYCKIGKLIHIKELPKRGPPYRHFHAESHL